MRENKILPSDERHCAPSFPKVFKVCPNVFDTDHLPL